MSKAQQLMPVDGSTLSIYENAKHWIAQYESIDEVKECMDKAAAVQEYARRADDLSLEHKAAKARMWAERRCGELLNGIEKATGTAGQLSGRGPSGGTVVVPPENNTPTLADIGLTKNQSSKYQQISKVPEDEFEKELAKLDGTNKTTISSGTILNKRARKAKEKAEAKAIQKTKSARVMLGDCLSVLDNIHLIDLLIADPPYFTDGDFTAHISACLKQVKRTGQAYVFTSADPIEIAAYLAVDSGEMELAQILVWNYNNTGQRQPNERYTSNYQIALYYRGPIAPPINKPADGKEQYACQTVNAPDGRVGDRYHKWQKPLELIERLIRNSSTEVDFVFDPFVGSGTTVIAAAALGREALGCDIDPEAIQICKQRGCIEV